MGVYEYYKKVGNMHPACTTDIVERIPLPLSLLYMKKLHFIYSLNIQRKMKAAQRRTALGKVDENMALRSGYFRAIATRICYTPSL